MRVEWLALMAALLAGGSVARAEEPAGRVVLRWQVIPGAASYDLQVAKDGAFTERELEARVPLSGFRLEPPPEERRYWRVRSVDADGRPGPWSRAKTIEPLVRGAEPVAEPELATLDVPPVPPAEVAAAALPQVSERAPDLPLDPHAGEELPVQAPPRDAETEGFTVLEVLRDGRPGVMVGWRANLLGVDAPWVAVEGSWPLPWFGAAYGAAVRVGWWRERAVVSIAGGLPLTIEADADVIPVAALLLRSFRNTWARLYAGVGLGVDLVVVRLPGEGALEASAAAEVVAGAGRRFGPGEAFGELTGGLGGVDGPLGRLRTGGIALSVGYRLWR